MAGRFDVDEAQQCVFQVRQEVEKVASYLRTVGLGLGAATRRWFVSGIALSVSEELVSLAAKLVDCARLTDVSLRERWERRDGNGKQTSPGAEA